MSIDREAERAWAELVTGNFFDVLGVPIVSGRGFTDADNQAGTPPTVVLSHAYWQRRFAADPQVIGRQVKINAQPFTIIGIAAEGFQGGESGLAYDMWLPIGTQPVVMPGGSRLEVRGSRWLSTLARLAPGATVDSARGELDAIIEQMRQTWASQGRYVDHTAGVFTLDNSPTGGVSVLRPVLLILMAVAGIVLLITCANLAGLLLARASARQREIAIRLSMGAGRLRDRAATAGRGTRARRSWHHCGAGGAALDDRPADWLRAAVGTADQPARGRLTRACCGSRPRSRSAPCCCFALAPAAQAAPERPGQHAFATPGGTGRAFGRHRLRRGLVAAQVALSISLLVGAGLCIRSLNAAAQMTPGFQADRVVVGWLDLFSAGYTADTGRAFYARLLERVNALPGRRVGVAQPAHSAGLQRRQLQRRDGRGLHAPDGESPIVGLNNVGPDYAATLGIPMVAGRDLTADDVAERPRVAVISETMARRFWADRDPIGGRVLFGRHPRRPAQPVAHRRRRDEGHQAAIADRAAAAARW